jgi:hypothetical protein
MSDSTWREPAGGKIRVTRYRLPQPAQQLIGNSIKPMLLELLTDSMATGIQDTPQSVFSQHLQPAFDILFPSLVLI